MENNYRIVGDTAIVTCEYGKKDEYEVWIDAHMVDYLNTLPYIVWSITPISGRMLCVSRHEGSQVLLHRIVTGATGGRQRVHFIDGDYLNCRLSNLQVHAPGDTLITLDLDE